VPDDVDFYVNLALSEDAVLDAAGGRVLDRLREAGHDGRLVGIGASELTAAAFEGAFALVVLTGDAFERRHAEREIVDLLTGARTALRPYGRVAFDSPNPLAGQGHETFPHAETLDSLIGRAGLTIHERYGDWDRSPFTPASPLIITVAGSAGER
jgi:hypothetical protein